jgi:hypothetical protein
MAKTRKRSDPQNPAASAPTALEEPRNVAAGEAAADDVQRDDERDDNARMAEEYRDRVARRAYELYLSRGGGHGADWDDWLAAEREINQSSAPESDGSGRGE